MPGWDIGGIIKEIYTSHKNGKTGERKI